ncbi:MAG: ATP-binding cassette domain-containing protein [Verrucomicrobiae bacterium]|nr:ATP-binding cassette domain-containing protein [Verrucomicrobiae bacterium]
MIKVENLTKRYSGFTAIDNISFEVKKGEIVGFLGPNGAGKSSTMRILSCFMPATSGRVSIAGFDVFDQSNEVRKRVGYMPESNPLYMEMRVNEYLQYRARLKQVPRKIRKERVERVKEQCGLKDVEKKIIAHLSKGYKQRVGLADALVHDPELLILDEPTIGLDPHQIRQVRELIKSLGKQHTILLSTHILPEVEMTCNRVIIIHKGKVVASDTPQNLTKTLKGGGATVIEVKGLNPDVVEKQFWTVPGVNSIQSDRTSDGYVRCEITPSSNVDLREIVFEKAVSNRWTIRELTRQRQSLEDIFVELTRVAKKQEEEEEA